ATSTYIRNPDCWAADLDLTGISPWNSTGGHLRAGTLISPCHIIFATHYQIGTGASLRLLTNDNQVINRTMSAKINIASSDFTIGKLDSDVPEGIGFYKIPPSGFLDYIPGISNGIHCCGVDQEEKMLVVDLKSVNGLLVFDFPHDAQSLAFNEKIITG